MGFIDMGAQSHAEYLVIRETKAVAAPVNLDYDEAVACLEGAFYALCSLKAMKPVAGQTALVYGATGAIGTAYLQLLKYYGLDVTAVCSADNKLLVESLGARRVIDYKTEDFTKDQGSYDLVLDAVGKISFRQSKHLLKKNGQFTSSGGFANVFLALITPLLGGRKVVFAIPKNVTAGLSFIKGLAESGAFKPVIDRRYPLDRIADAYSYVASGQKIGNVIITINT
jgi:NADPH:quinone reductase-like Zn-dependent oxidoreductase